MMGGRKGEREGGREAGREGGMEGRREGGREEGREEGRDGGKERGSLPWSPYQRGTSPSALTQRPSGTGLKKKIQIFQTSMS
jgi:hypothetical protein